MPPFSPPRLTSSSDRRELGGGAVDLVNVASRTLWPAQRKEKKYYLYIYFSLQPHISKMCCVRATNFCLFFIYTIKIYALKGGDAHNCDHW
jgi:hypothetical protein